ncbi:MAG: hypothetical protein RIR00_272 [Pseudomonadota bacterium]
MPILPCSGLLAGLLAQRWLQALSQLMPRLPRPCSRLLPLLLPLLFAGCALDSAGLFRQLAADSPGFQVLRSGDNPPLQALLRPGRERLWVIIEGDGLAWLDRHTPSPDPTPPRPRDAVGWRLSQTLAANREHAGDAILYLSRPCQFLDDAARRPCQPESWTHARFGAPVLARLNAAMDQARQVMGPQAPTRLILAGYSGGGVLAALLAVRRPDCVGLLTVAAPLDHAAWTRHHQISPLDASLSLRPDLARLARIPQLHLSGGRDEVVPATLTAAFLREFPSGAPARQRVFPELDHRWLTETDLADLLPPSPARAPRP